MNNGKISFTVLPTRGMSIGKVDVGGSDLGWSNPVKEICVNPAYVDLQDFSGLGWLTGCACALVLVTW